jgi:hypothetical protein
VNQHISHIRHFAPGDFRVFPAEGGCNVLGSLTKYFKAPDDGIDGSLVSLKRLEFMPRVNSSTSAQAFRMSLR